MHAATLSPGGPERTRHGWNATSPVTRFAAEKGGVARASPALIGIDLVGCRGTFGGPSVWRDRLGRLIFEVAKPFENDVCRLRQGPVPRVARTVHVLQRAWRNALQATQNQKAQFGLVEASHWPC